MSTMSDQVIENCKYSTIKVSVTGKPQPPLGGDIVTESLSRSGDSPWSPW